MNVSGVLLDPTDSDSIDNVLGSLITTYTWPTSSLTYAIAQSSYDIDPASTDYNEETAFVAFSDAGEDMIRSAFSAWEDVSLVSFTEGVAAEETADIVVGGSSVVSTAWAYLPNTGSGTAGGDIWVGADKSYNELFVADDPTPYVGSYEYYVILHEIGHSLGLKHPHAAFSTSTDIMDTAYDAVEYTIMSYRSFVGASASTGLTNLQGHLPQSLMMLDIAAIQAMYGANYSTYSGNTTYSFDVNTGEMYINGVSTGATEANVVFRTLWDGGGTDVIDLSGYTTSMEVSLAAGGFILFDVENNYQRAFLGKVNGEVQYAQANVYMSLLYEGDTRSLIENVTTGSGDDDILGNEADNQINAGTGLNSVDGAAGIDTVVMDTMASANVSILVETDGSVTFSDGTVTTKVTNVEYVQFSDDTYEIAALVALYASSGASGSAQLTVLLENANGDPGDDPVDPGDPQDPLTDYYGVTFPLLEGTTGSDDLYASGTAMVIMGDAGDDKIWLATGDDVAVGGAGADRFVVDLRKTSVTGLDLITDLSFAEGDRVYFYSSVSGAFSNDYNPSNDYWTGAAGELAFVASFEDLEEVVASDGISVSQGQYGLVLDFSNLGVDRELELAGYTLDMFDSYTLTAPVGTIPPAVDVSTYTDLGYTSVLGTETSETLSMKKDMTVYSGLAGADRFNWDMRTVTDGTQEAIIALDFDEGDWLSILTVQAGTFSEPELSESGLWTGNDGEFLYIRSLEDLSIAVSSGALTAEDGDFGLVLRVADPDFDRALEITGLWESDLLAIA